MTLRSTNICTHKRARTSMHAHSRAPHHPAAVLLERQLILVSPSLRPTTPLPDLVVEAPVSPSRRKRRRLKQAQLTGAGGGGSRLTYLLVAPLLVIRCVLCVVWVSLWS